LFACGGGDLKMPADKDLLASISVEAMKAHTDVLADDEMAGRIPGSIGHNAARDYIVGEMEAVGLEPFGLDDTFVLPYENGPTSDRYQLDAAGEVVPNAVDTGYDLVGVLPGTDPDLAHEHIVVMAHYDHLGVDKNGNPFNGAFDNASAVGMCLEVARALRDADALTRRSIAFVFTDDEEAGLDGAAQWLENSTVALDDIVFGLSADPLGRPMLPDFAPTLLMGFERSPRLRERFQATASWSANPLFLLYRDVIPYFASDQDRFYEAGDGVPAAWFVNPGMSFYHTIDDDPITIDYRVVKNNADYLANVLLHFGNDDERFAFEGPPRLGADAARGVIELFEASRESASLTDEERARIDEFLVDFRLIEETDDFEAAGNPEVLKVTAVYFLAFELSIAHPGPIPPPWPEQ
jgi:hypothetical protein